MELTVFLEIRPRVIIPETIPSLMQTGAEILIVVKTIEYCIKTVSLAFGLHTY